jgi:hypothetical protein
VCVNGTTPSDTQKQKTQNKNKTSQTPPTNMIRHKKATTTRCPLHETQANKQPV